MRCRGEACLAPTVAASLKSNLSMDRYVFAIDHGTSGIKAAIVSERGAVADFEFEPKLADVRLDMDAPTKPDATGNYPLPLPGITKYL